ncbi:MAG: hypothetical protein KA421_05225 [Rhodoluna sp.]|nr:hypothetical protein [Rhodoluna sp.]
MKVSQTLVAGLASLLLLVAATPALAADRYNPEGTKISQDEILTTVVDGGGGSTESRLVIQPDGVSEGGTRGQWLHCYGSGDPTCDYGKAGIDILQWAVLPNCEVSSSSYCVKSLEVAAQSQEFKQARFLGEAKGGLRLAADPTVSMIEGGRPSLYEAADAPHAGGGTNYAVVAVATGHFNQKTKKYEVTDLNTSVIPYVNESGVNYKAGWFDKTSKPEDAYRGGGYGSSCAFVEDGNCGSIQDFASGTRFKLQMTIPKSVGGWFQGRMKDPQLAVDASAKVSNLLTVEAEAVTIPKMAVIRSMSDYTTKEKTWLQNLGYWGTPNGKATGVRAGEEAVFEYLEFYRKMAKDTAAGVQSMWNFGTVIGGVGSPCLSDTSKVIGIVTTNSMGFEGKSPAFTNGYLNYKVTGLHFMPDGTTPVQGTYDLVMRSDAARCLYGFTNAPISATVSVTGGDSSSVATTVVSEKNGWLKMAAYGFTFSQKTLTVRMTQAKAPAVKKTITCVNGKVTKKVTAVNAKCPAGYKKK